MRYFIEIAYKGTDFHGWQQQPNAMSVQEHIQKGLNKILGTNTTIVGAGRTDTGVHANQMYAHFDTQKELNKKDFAYRLNSVIPESIFIKQILKVSATAHARFDAISRSYEYHIHLAINPFLLETTQQIYQRKFDLEKMNQAAKILLDHTNFKAFSKSRTDVKTYECNLTTAKWEQKEEQLVFYITANRFLRNMVRAIVGTLLEVGEGKLSIPQFKKVIQEQKRSKAGVSVPAKGLFLTDIKYPEGIFQ